MKKAQGLWGVFSLTNKVVVPWFLLLSSTSKQLRFSLDPYTAVNEVDPFENAVSLNTVLVPPNLPTVMFSRLTTTETKTKKKCNPPTTTVITTTNDEVLNDDNYNDYLCNENQNKLNVQDDESPPNSRHKPLVLYLPDGLQGQHGVSAFMQYQAQDLTRAFDVWRLAIVDDSRDRSTFQDLLQAVTWFLEQQQQQQRQQQTQDDNTASNAKSCPPTNDDDEIQRQRIYLIGDSFGGLLATAVVSHLQQTEATFQQPKLAKNGKGVVVDGVMWINPTRTAFSPKSTNHWDVVDSMLALSDSTDDDDDDSNGGAPSTSFMSSSFLAVTVGRSFRLMPRIVHGILLQRRNSTLADWMDIGLKMKLALDTLQQNSLPTSTVRHRIREWLGVGDASVTLQHITSITTPVVLVVAGSSGDDRAMLFPPSQDYAKQLQNEIPSCETIVVQDVGRHSVVLDDRVNLTHAMIRSKLLDPLSYWANKPPAYYDPITDWKTPPPSQWKAYMNLGYGPFRKWFSPVFFSTDPRTGRRWKGLSRLPSFPSKQMNISEKNNYDEESGSSSSIVRSPIVLVGNHQFAGFDWSMAAAELREQRNWTRLRGLVHPWVFQPPNASTGNTMPDADDTDIDATKITSPWQVHSSAHLKKVGAVPVTPRNFYRLLETGQNILLYPGGAREAAHGRNEAYRIFWPNNKTDFCRTAAKFNATIIPVSGVGMADSFLFLMDYSELVKLPLVGDRFRQQYSLRLPAARFDSTDDEGELIQLPLTLPFLPARNYYLFGRPISTHNISHHDRQACAALYQQVQAEMRQGLADLLAAREHDPYRNTLLRLLYEQVTGKRAPTFPVDVLNSRNQ